MNKIMKFGSLFFTIVLFLYSLIRYFSRPANSVIYYFIAAVGFFVVYLTYRKKSP